MTGRIADWFKVYLAAKVVILWVREVLQKPEARQQLELHAREAAKLAGQGLRWAAAQLKALCREIGREDGPKPR